MAIRITFILGLVALGAGIFLDRAPADTCSARHQYATCFAALNR